MPRKANASAKDFFEGVALFAGIGLVLFLLLILALLVIAILIFFGLTAFTNWNFGDRGGCSLISAFVIMKVLGLIWAMLDLIPDSKNAAELKTTPCPECGKNLRTALAQQCVHCGADWHS